MFKELAKDLNPSDARTYRNSKFEVRYADQVADAILIQAEEDCADLIVLGVNKASHLVTHLPDITSHIIANCKCPVLTLSS